MRLFVVHVVETRIYNKIKVQFGIGYNEDVKEKEVNNKRSARSRRNVNNAHFETFKKK